MKILIATLLTIVLTTLPASATHHRAHAIVHLGNACNQLNQSVISLNRWEDSLLSPNLNTFGVARGNLARVTEAACITVPDMLANGEDLDVVRRELTQPNQIERPVSAVIDLFFVLYGIDFTVVGTEGQGADYRNFYRFVARLNDAWKHTDLTIWHVNDAIREEIYLDPDFQ